MSSSDSSVESKKKKPARNHYDANLLVVQAKNQPVSPQPVNEKGDSSSNLYQQNRKLRRKLKELSSRLDVELQKAAQNKLKMNYIKVNGGSTAESQNLQLQNAYKMIERLQKTVKDFESKQAYHVTLKRVLDLENIIKKKDIQNEELKLELKTVRKTLKDKERYIQELLESTKKMGNPTEDLEVINKLKAKLKKIISENEHLRKKELQKHQKMVKAERKLVQIEQNQNETPIGRQEDLVNEIQDWKIKYKDAMQRVQRQNLMISKLNERISRIEDIHKERKTQIHSVERKLSKSVEQLPQVGRRKEKAQQIADLIDHLPQPKIAIKLKRY